MGWALTPRAGPSPCTARPGAARRQPPPPTVCSSAAAHSRAAPTPLERTLTSSRTPQQEPKRRHDPHSAHALRRRPSRIRLIAVHSEPIAPEFQCPAQPVRLRQERLACPSSCPAVHCGMAGGSRRRVAAVASDQACAKHPTRNRKVVGSDPNSAQEAEGGPTLTSPGLTGAFVGPRRRPLGWTVVGAVARATLAAAIATPINFMPASFDARDGVLPQNRAAHAVARQARGPERHRRGFWWVERPPFMPVALGAERVHNIALTR